MQHKFRQPFYIYKISLNHFYEYKDVKELKNKKFNLNGIIAYDLNTKFSEYVKNVKAKNETHFLTLFTDIGLLVIETDNDEYYKVTYFQD